jgi:hypothetical protein
MFWHRELQQVAKDWWWGDKLGQGLAVLALCGLVFYALYAVSPDKGAS